MKKGVGERLTIWLLPRLIKLVYLFLVNTIRWQIIGTPYSPMNPSASSISSGMRAC